MTTDVQTFARCLQCDWEDQGPGADKAAEKHVKVTKHSTATASYPVPSSGAAVI